MDEALEAPAPLPAKRKRPPVPGRGRTGIDIKKRVYNPGNHRYEVPIETLVALRNSELSINVIAKLLHCKHQTVVNRLSEADAKLAAVPGFRKVKSDLIAAREMDLMGHMTRSKMKDASLKDVAISLNILHGMGRLEDGKSTSNVATYAQSRLKEEESRDVIKQTEEELKRLEQENPHYAEMETFDAIEDISESPEDDLSWLE